MTGTSDPPARRAGFFLWLFRIARLGGTLLACALVWVFLRIFQRWMALEDAQVRAIWMSETAKALLEAIGGSVRIEGELPRSGLIVSNHLGYVDILVIGSRAPVTFVAKRDVRAWPVFGALTRMAGTVFVDREDRSRLGAALEGMRERLDARLPVVLFPEGTSTAGQEVLPFLPSLLAVAEERSLPVTPIAIRYSIPGADPGQTICYWGDMVFFPHLMELLRYGPFEAIVRVGEPRDGSLGRKALARMLRADVLALLGEANP